MSSGFDKAQEGRVDEPNKFEVKRALTISKGGRVSVDGDKMVVG